MHMISCMVSQGALSVPHLLVSHEFEEVLHMAAPSEGAQSYMEGMQDDMVDRLTRTVNIISSFFELLDLDQNGSVELGDLHRMQVCLSAALGRPACTRRSTQGSQPTPGHLYCTNQHASCRAPLRKPCVSVAMPTGFVVACT